MTPPRKSNRRAAARLLGLLWLVALTACTGADFNLPSITDADVDRAALTVSSAGASSLPKFPRSRSDEEKMVERAAERLRRAAPPICAHAKLTSCYFTVEYSADDEVNAYAEGTSKVVISHGLLRYLETEHEVAAVLGHEFGHHIAEHIEERQTNATIGAVIGAVIAGGAILATGAQNTPSEPNAVGDAMNSSAKLGAQIGALSYSKEEEREADLLSAYLLARASYDLEQAGRVWRVLAILDGDTRSSMFSTHPAGPERMAAWEKTIVLVENSPDRLPDWKP